MIKTETKSKFTIDQPRNGGLLAAYFPVNDPLIPLSRLKAYETACVDVVELGIKTATPYADGEIVAASMKRASGQGTVAEATEAIRTVQEFDRGVLGMVFAYAEPKIAPDPTVWNEVDGLLTIGAVSPVSDSLIMEAQQHGARITRFVPYDLSPHSVSAACTATGFVFLQYTSGKTGIRHETDPHLSRRVQQLRNAGVTAPIFAGIGISTREQADHAMQAGVDGIVVGSKAVEKAIEGHGALEDYLCELREALND